MLLEQFEAECISCGEIEKVFKSNITFEYKGKMYGFNLCKNHSTIIEPIIDLEKIIKTIKEKIEHLWIKYPLFCMVSLRHQTFRDTKAKSRQFFAFFPFLQGS